MLNRSSNAAKTWVVVFVGALVLALAAFFVLSNSSPDSILAHPHDEDADAAQHTDNDVEGHIHYDEITDPDADVPPVKTFKSVDPEGAKIDWDVTGLDADDFEISANGELRFKMGKEPDFEKPTDRDRADDPNTTDVDESEDAKDNAYEITLRATEIVPGDYDGRALSTERDITVVINNVDEEGKIRLQWREPEVGTPIQAYLIDPDVGVTNESVVFTWYVDTVDGEPDPEFGGHWEAIPNAGFDEAVPDTTDPTTEHTPRGKRAADVISQPSPNAEVDEGKYLRVMASYTDAQGEEKTAVVRSEFPIRAERTTGETDSENGSPDFEPAEIERSVSEAAYVGDPVMGAVVAMDPNTVNPEDRLTYEIVREQGTPSAMDLYPHPDVVEEDVPFFSIDHKTGQITVAQTLDFDSNPDQDNADGEYTIVVRATDPSGEDTEAIVTITAMRANDGPKISGASELRVHELDSDDADENGEPDTLYMPLTGMINNDSTDNLEGGTGANVGVYGDVMGNVYKASDEDAIDQITWTLEGEDGHLFAINKIPGPDEPRELKFKTPPLFPSPDFEYPDFEAPMDANKDSVYKVTLVATDGADLHDRKDVTIFVDNMQEAGKVEVSTRNAEGETVALGAASPVVGRQLTAEVVDPDGGVAVVTWQWSKSSTASGPYVPITGKTSNTYTPVETDAGTVDGSTSGAFLRVTATYTDTLTEEDVQTTDSMNFDERVQKGDFDSPIPKGPRDAHGGDMGLYRAMATSENAVRREPPEEQLEQPEVTPPQLPSGPIPILCPSETVVLMVAENAETGAFVGDPLTGCDGGNGTLSYDLRPGSQDNDLFSVTAGLGSPESPGFPRVTVGSVTKPRSADTDPVLDYETDPEHTIIIRAMDEANPRQAGFFRATINVQNLNEVPAFSAASLGKSQQEHPEDNQNKVVTFVAEDPDGGNIVWYVTGTDADDFEIVNGELSFNSNMFPDGPDYENPTDRDRMPRVEGVAMGDDPNDPADDPNDGYRDNIYEITIRATEMSAIDGGPAKSAELDVTVTVTQREERGKVTLSWLQPEVGTPITARTTDPDAVTSDNPDGAIAADDVTYTWYRSKVSQPFGSQMGQTIDPDDIPDEWIQVTGSTSGTGNATATYTPEGDDADTEDTEAAVDEGKYLLAEATYDTNKKAVGISLHQVRADVSAAHNGSPDFQMNERTIEVSETIDVADPVGTVIVDEEPDRDVLTYELVALGGDDHTIDGADANNPNNEDVGFFKIDRETAEITLRKPLSYENDDGRDYEGDAAANPPEAVAPGEYKFIVRATDPSGEGLDESVTPNVYRDSDEITVTVMVMPENEAPVLTDGDADLQVDEADSTKEPGDVDHFIGIGFELTGAAPNRMRQFSTDAANLYKVVDPDGIESPEWRVEGLDAKYFKLGTPDDGIGRRLRFKDDFEYASNDIRPYTPDFEKPGDENRDNVYEVTVVVRDNQGAEGKKAVRVEVMNVWEEGKLTLTPVQPYVPGMDAEVTATLEDADGVESITYWQWYWTATEIDILDYDGDDDENDRIIDENGNLIVPAGARTTGPNSLKVVDGKLVSEGPSDTTTDDDITIAGKISGDMIGVYNQTLVYTAEVTDIGRYLHAHLEYRDGWSVDDVPGTAHDERNDDGTTDADPVTDGRQPTTDYDSDEMANGATKNAVQTDTTASPDGEDGEAGEEGDGEAGPPAPELDSDRVEVAENTPGSGYVGGPIEGFRANGGWTYELVGTDAQYFAFADDMQEVYDQVPDAADATFNGENRQDKPGQLALALEPVTHLDRESEKNSYEVELRGTLTGSERVHIITVEIEVTGVNDAPSEPEESGVALEVQGQASVYREEGDSLEVATYQIGGTESGSATWAPLGGAGADLFDLSDVGVLTFKMPPDYEMPMDSGGYNQYQVRLTATAPSTGDDPLEVSRDVAVIINNKDEPGTIMLSPRRPVIDREIVASLTDPDGPRGAGLPLVSTMITEDVEWQWYRADEMGGRYTFIDGATGASYTPIETEDPAEDSGETKVPDDVGKFLRVMATYVDGHNAGKTVSMEAMGSVTDTLAFEGDMIERIVEENTEAGENVGDPVMAAGGPSETVTYTLGGADMASFDIDMATGQIMVGADTMLDYETQDMYTVTVTATGTATDGSTETSMTTVTIMLNNVDEMGRVTFWRDGADATNAAIMVGDMLTGLAEDPDGNLGATPPITGENGDMYPNISSATWQWARTMTPAANNWVDIAGADMAEYTVMEADTGYYLRATAMYEDGEDTGKMAQMMTSAAVGEAPPAGGILATYDADDSGLIERSEAVKAVLDFLIRKEITRDQAIEVVTAFILQTALP